MCDFLYSNLYLNDQENLTSRNVHYCQPSFSNVMISVVFFEVSFLFSFIYLFIYFTGSSLWRALIVQGL